MNINNNNNNSIEIVKVSNGYITSEKYGYDRTVYEDLKDVLEHIRNKYEDKKTP